ncbi:hypothetical protein [uncultured Rikenella sp.]|nr:hypothetical protein [uncultured Rikenella sp.]
MGGIGRYGYSWSSTTGSLYGQDLNFNAQGLSTSYSDSRGHGLQLRCLSE